MKQQARTRNSQREKKLPVFVFPEELKFDSDDESAHKQILTLYNPYDFNVKFQILSNAPHKYAVVESQGLIKAHCCVDIVVRHRAATEGPFDVTDKFRIDIFVDKKLIGRKHVVSSLQKGSSAEVSEEKEVPGRFLSMPGGASLARPERQANANSSPTVLTVVMAIVCLGVLLLPLEGESPNWPPFLHISVNQKLITAFALGLVTMVLLKS